MQFPPCRVLYAGKHTLIGSFVNPCTRIETSVAYFLRVKLTTPAGTRCILTKNTCDLLKHAGLVSSFFSLKIVHHDFLSGAVDVG